MKGVSMQDIANAKSDEQRRDMQALEAAKVCLFCPQGLSLKDKRVFHRGEHWYVTPNDFPYDGTKVHVMIVPNRHLLSFTDLSSEEILELPKMLGWVNREFGIEGASMFARYGNTRYTGATIHHFHLHVAQGTEKSEKTKPIFALIGYKQPPEGEQP
jgi:ATP adenylyltransferase